MNFRDIVGQNRVISILKNYIVTRKIANAYTFYGPLSSGKKTTAIIFSQALNCKYLKDSEPCGICNSCRRIEKGTHNDVSIFLPEKKKGFNIDKARDIKKWASVKPIENEYRIVIIEASLGIMIEAANCLLKILEDPPPNLCIIIIAIPQHQLPSTVVSRCVPVYFNSLSLKDVKKILEKNDINCGKNLDLIYSLVNGNMEEIIKISDSKFVEKALEKVNKIFSGIYYQFPPKIMEIIKKLSEEAKEHFDLNSPHSILFILKILLLTLQKSLILQFSEKNSPLPSPIKNRGGGIYYDSLNGKESPSFKESGSFIEKNIGLIDEIYKCYNSIERFANPTTVLTALSIKLSNF